MSGKCLILFTVTAALYSVSNASSYSMSCIYINGEQRCTANDDPDGNMAGAAAGVQGSRGMVASGAGNGDSFSVNRDQIGYGGNNQDVGGNPNYQPFPGTAGNNQGAGGNPNYQPFPGSNQGGGGNSNYQPFPGFGTYGGGGMAVAGTGVGNFNPQLPRFDNPFQFVQDFMGGQRWQI